MSEIEKMYDNAGVILIEKDESGAACINPFTPLKQFKLVEFINNINFLPHRVYFLAKIINSLWQDLTEEERKQIKEILE